MDVNEQTAVDHGLTKEEFKKINNLLKRKPNLTELAIFSAMWNEHCSYKSSRIHLKNLHTKGSKVIQGPGENAGIIDIGDDDAIVFKIESHNHPSFIEPYQGAATGVGGIMRDVFTMGARPIANLNSIHFGSTQHKKTKNLLRGVVKGIGGYGNCIGVPTIAGQTNFDESYNGNILVNAMTLGLVNKKKIFYSKAAGLDKPVIYVGNLNSLRTIADVRDAVRAYIMLLSKKNNAGQIYNIGGNYSCKVGDILKFLVSKSPMRKLIKIKVDKKRLRPIDADLQIPNTKKFRKHYNWKPDIEFEQTMNDLLNYWRKKIKNNKSIYLTR